MSMKWTYDGYRELGCSPFLEWQTQYGTPDGIFRTHLGHYGNWQTELGMVSVAPQPSSEWRWDSFITIHLHESSVTEIQRKLMETAMDMHLHTVAQTSYF